MEVRTGERRWAYTEGCYTLIISIICHSIYIYIFIYNGLMTNNKRKPHRTAVT